MKRNGAQIRRQMCRSERSRFRFVVAKIIARLERDLGRPPTDAEVARWLAISPTRVAHHRALLAEDAGE